MIQHHMNKMQIPLHKGTNQSTLSYGLGWWILTVDDCAPVKNYCCEGMWLLDEGFMEGRCSAAFALPAKNLSNSAGKTRRETQRYSVMNHFCFIASLVIENEINAATEYSKLMFF